MAQKILGIDVGAYSIKVAEIERTLRSFKLVAFYEQPILQYENVSTEANTAQALVKLFEEYNLSTDFLYTALPGQLSANRVVHLPFSEFKKIDATIEFELENYLPLPLEEMTIDYKVLSSNKESSHVFVSYAKKSDFVKSLNTLSEANLDPRFVGSETVEIANLMKLNVLQPEGAYSIVDIGHEKSNVLIFMDGQLQFARTIMVGGKNLTEAIAQNLQIPLNEAERMKIEMGQVGMGLETADTTTRQISESMKNPLMDLVLQLKQTFMSFQQTHNEVVQAMILCGGTSRLPGIDVFLSAELRKNVSFLDCLDFPFNQISDTTWCRPIAATALSLAYRGVIGYNNKDLQYRRGEFAYLGEVKDVVGFAKQTAFLLGVIFFVGLGSYIANYVVLTGKQKDQQAKIVSMAKQAAPELTEKVLSSPNAMASAIEGKISEIDKKKKKISEETSLSTISILKEFSSVIPPREAFFLEVDNFQLNAKKVQVQGKIKNADFDKVDALKESLMKSKMFKNVSTTRTDKRKEDIFFTISFDVVLDEAKLAQEIH